MTSFSHHQGPGRTSRERPGLGQHIGRHVPEEGCGFRCRRTRLPKCGVRGGSSRKRPQPCPGRIAVKTGSAAHPAAPVRKDGRCEVRKYALSYAGSGLTHSVPDRPTCREKVPMKRCRPDEATTFRYGDPGSNSAMCAGLRGRPIRPTGCPPHETASPRGSRSLVRNRS